MPRAFVNACLSIAILIGGCRGLPQRAALPGAHEVPVEQLVFHTDFKLPAEDPLIRELTSERELVYGRLGLTPSTTPIHVFLFRDAEIYKKYQALHFPGVPTRRAFFVESSTRLAVYAHWSERVAEDLRHEVAHGYLHAVVPELPLWLDEGLAEYFEVPRGRGGLNRPHLDLLSDMMQYDGWRPNLARLEQLSQAAEMQQRDYAEAWAWVYFMLEGDPDRQQLLNRYLADLQMHGVAEPISTRLAARHVRPEQTLAEYLKIQSEELAAKDKPQIAR